MIHLIKERATRQQLEQMLQTLVVYVKLAVDIKRGIIAGGGDLHADCEDVLLTDGSLQEDIRFAAHFNTLAIPMGLGLV